MRGYIRTWQTWTTVSTLLGLHQPVCTATAYTSNRWDGTHRRYASPHKNNTVDSTRFWLQPHWAYCEELECSPFVWVCVCGYGQPHPNSIVLPIPPFCPDILIKGALAKGKFLGWPNLAHLGCYPLCAPYNLSKQSVQAKSSRVSVKADSSPSHDKAALWKQAAISH